MAQMYAELLGRRTIGPDRRANERTKVLGNVWAEPICEQRKGGETHLSIVTMTIVLMEALTATPCR